MDPLELLRLLDSLERNPELLTRQHLKKIYALLIACGHYPICPWCEKPIINIDDFSWDHIVPKSAGGGDSINNLQPMHKHCNNASKNDNIVYEGDYEYDIKSNLYKAILDMRPVVSKQNIEEATKKKEKYKNRMRNKGQKKR